MTPTTHRHSQWTHEHTHRHVTQSQKIKTLKLIENYLQRGSAVRMKHITCSTGDHTLHLLRIYTNMKLFQGIYYFQGGSELNWLFCTGKEHFVPLLPPARMALAADIRQVHQPVPFGHRISACKSLQHITTV